MEVKDLEGKIINADCMDILKQLPDKCIDLVLTDFPYNEVNRDSNGLRNLDMGCADKLEIDLHVLLHEIIRVCKGSFYAFCGRSQISTIHQELVQNGFSTRLIVWEKTNPSPMNGQHIWLSGIETCVFGKAKNAVFNENCKNTVLRYPLCADEYRFHTTQKPLDLFSYLVTVSSDRGGGSIRSIFRLRYYRNSVPPLKTPLYLHRKRPGVLGQKCGKIKGRTSAVAIILGPTRNA